MCGNKTTEFPAAAGHRCWGINAPLNKERFALRGWEIRFDMLPIVLLAFSLLTLTVLTSQTNALDFSCATFHAFLTEPELTAKFGPENVTTGPVFGADDGPTDGTILFANRDDAKVEIAWNDPETKQNPLWIKVRGERSRWRTPNGVSLGDDLLTIERRNGWPFRLAGFGSEGHGTLQDWGVGRLGNTPNCDIKVSFQPRANTTDISLLRQVTSLPHVSSGHPAMQKINPKVVELWIRHRIPQSPANPDDAILDVLVWGIHMTVDPERCPDDLRAALQQYLRQMKPICQ